MAGEEVLPTLGGSSSRPGRLQWHVLENAWTELPPVWQSNDVVEMDQEGWQDVLDQLEPLLHLCTDLHKGTSHSYVTAFLSGLHIGRARQACQHRTQCLLMKRESEWQKLAWLEFRPSPTHGSKRNSPSRGYFWVKPGGLGMGEAGGIYLHHLLLWMFAGPAPAGRECGHTCNHKMCICPWHMAWVTKGENKQAHWNTVKRLNRKMKE